MAAVLLPDGPAPVGGRRRGSPTSTRASTSSASASSGTASEAASKRVRLHLPVEEGARGDHGQGEDADPPGHNTNRSSDLLRRLNPVLRGWTQLLPARGVQGHLRLPARLHLAAGRRLAAPQDTPAQLEVAPRRYLPRGWCPARATTTLFDPECGADRSLPLPGRTASRRHGRAQRPPRPARMSMGSWRAGCGGTRTSGSGSGPGKRTGRNASTAPRFDSTNRLLGRSARSISHRCRFRRRAGDRDRQVASAPARVRALWADRPPTRHPRSPGQALAPPGCRLDALRDRVRAVAAPMPGLPGCRAEPVPWARPGAHHTRDFEDVIAWLAQQMAKTPITKLMRIGWDTVGTIVERVVSDHLDDALLTGLVAIGCARASSLSVSVPSTTRAPSMPAARRAAASAALATARHAAPLARAARATAADP